MTGRIEQVNSLENDESVHSQFLKSLGIAKPNIGVHAMNNLWRHAFNAIHFELKNIHSTYQIDWGSVKEMLLLSAEYGLSFDPRAKELFIEVIASELKENELRFALGLKYNGMKHRLVKACGVRMMTTEVVYEKDTFEWRGQWNEPLYVMANETSEIRCAFGMVKLKSGEVMAFKLDRAELLELERNDIERATQVYNNPDASFYRGAYRKRMFEIATLRYLYRELISCFDTDDITEQSYVNEHNDLAEALEDELNAVKKAG